MGFYKKSKKNAMASIYLFQLLEIGSLHYLTLLLIPPLLLLLTMKHVMRVKEGRKLKLPPSPPTLPLIGNLHQLGTLPHSSFWELSKKYGPLMYLQLGKVPTLIVSSAKAAKEVLKTHDLAFCTRPSIIALDKLSYGRIDIAFAPYSEQWRQFRKICLVELLSTRRVQESRPIREEEIWILMRKISKLSKSGPVNLSDLLLCLLNDITCREVFGKKFSTEEDSRSQFHEMVGETIALMGGFTIRDFFPALKWVNAVTGLNRRLEKNFHDMDSLWEEIIEGCIMNNLKEEKNDFVSVLLRFQKESDLTISRDHIKAMMMNMFIGGTDTSSTTIEWGMAELMKNPRVMKKAQDEVWAVMGNKEKVEESDVDKLEYVKLIVKETFRLHPPVTLLLPRECKEECKIDGYDIPKGTAVYVNVWGIGRDPKSWENPNEFFPERFIDSPIGFGGQSYELLPFGGGRRLCAGLTLGAARVELAMANLLHCFKWDLPPGMTGEDVDMSETFGIVAHKKEPLFVVATPRT